MKSRILIIALLSLSATGIFAQEESPNIRRGNRQYADSAYSAAEVEYRRALDKNAHSYAARYNLGNSLFRQGKYNGAAQAYSEAAQYLNSQNKKEKQQLANSYHNLGNSLFAQQQYAQAIAAYQQSLRLNPKDNDTRYNLVKAMEMLQQQQEEQNQDQQQQQQQQQQEKQEQQEQEQNQDQQQQQQQQQENQMDKETAEQILQALEQDEQDTQEKLQRQQGKKRRVEKEW